MRRSTRREIVDSLYWLKSCPQPLRSRPWILAKCFLICWRVELMLPFEAVRWAAYSSSLAGMASTGRMWSTRPVEMALRRIASYLAVSSVWAMAMPPCSFTAVRPSVPSEPVPDIIMHTALSPQSSAKERNRESIGVRWPRASEGGCTLNTLSLMVSVALGGMI